MGFFWKTYKIKIIDLIISKTIHVFIFLDIREMSNFGPSKLRALPLGFAAERSVNYFCDYFGPREVSALPLGVAIRFLSFS